MKRILQSLDGEKLKESWFWDRDELIDQRNEINKKLRLLDKERKQQPALIAKSNFGDDVYYIDQYKLTQTPESDNVCRIQKNCD